MATKDWYELNGVARPTATPAATSPAAAPAVPQVSQGGGSSPVSPVGTYTDGGSKYTKNSDGSVDKVRPDGTTVHIAANDPNMQYIPQVAGGTYNNPTAGSTFKDGENEYVQIGNHTYDKASYQSLLASGGLGSFNGAVGTTGFNPIPYKGQNQVTRISYADALAKAQGRLNPLYENTKKKVGESLDIDADRRGISKSELGAAVYGNKMADIENQQQSDVTGMATQLESQNAADVNAAEAAAYQQYESSLANQLATWKAQQDANYQQGQLELDQQSAKNEKAKTDAYIQSLNKKSTGTGGLSATTTNANEKFAVEQAVKMSTVGGVFDPDSYETNLKKIRIQLGLEKSGAPVSGSNNDNSLSQFLNSYQNKVPSAYEITMGGLGY